MIKNTLYTICTYFCGILVLFAQPSADPSGTGSLAYYHEQLKASEEEILRSELEYASTAGAHALAALQNKKVKREVLALFTSKLLKKQSLDLSEYTLFSKVQSKILDKQKELEQMYDLKINFVIDRETEQSVAGLGTKLLKTVTGNEQSATNRKIDVNVHFDESAGELSFSAVFSQPLAAEMINKPEFSEKKYEVSTATGTDSYITTSFNTELAAYLKSLGLSINASNIVELQKMRNTDNTFSFITPAGLPYTLPVQGLQSVRFYFNDKTPGSNNSLSFRADGALQGFVLAGTYYGACYSVKDNKSRFEGYATYPAGTKVCSGPSRPDDLSKGCSQKDCVIIATSCMANGVLKFNVQKLPLQNMSNWPPASHTGVGAFVSPVPVNFNAGGKKAEITDYSFTTPYCQVARDFLDGNNTCDSKYVPYVITIANLINEVPEIYQDCYSVNWLLSNFAIHSAQSQFESFETYEERVNRFINRLALLQNSAGMASGNSTLTQISGPSKLYEELQDYNSCEFRYMSDAQRIHVVKTFASATMLDKHEKVLLSMMDAIEGENSTNNFLNGLIAAGNNVNGKSLLYRMFDDFDDLGDGNYSSLVKQITALVARSTLQGADLPDYSAYTTSNPLTTGDPHLFYWDDCYSKTSTAGSELTCTSWLKGTTRYDKIEMLASGEVRVKSKTKNLHENLNAQGQIYYTYTTRDYNLMPYKLVAFADNTRLHEIDENLGGDGSCTFLPACFLEYADYTATKASAIRNTAIAADVVLMATGLGELSVGFKAFRAASGAKRVIKGVRLGWAGLEAGGAALNLAVNLSLNDDPEFKGFVENYNMLILGLSLPQVFKGLTKLSSGALQNAGVTYNNVAYLITEKAALLTANPILKKQLLTKLAIYNFKISEANALKTLKNQALKAESDYLTNNYIKVFHKDAYDEAVKISTYYALKEGYLLPNWKKIEEVIDDDATSILGTQLQYLPGPVLPLKIAETFADKIYINRKLSSNEKFYKYHGINNRTGKKYSWFTNRLYSSEAELRSGLAIRNDWGIEITFISEFNVPSGTWISEGKAAQQGMGFPGQHYQAVIMNSAKAWIIKTTSAFK
jgi:hypothetical protein